MNLNNKIGWRDDKPCNTTNDSVGEVSRLIAEHENAIIARFVEVVGLKDEYEDAVSTIEQSGFTDYAHVMGLQEFTNRGYTIEQHRLDYGRIVDGVAESMKWRWSLLHDGKVVMYSDIEANVGIMRRTVYGGERC